MSEAASVTYRVLIVEDEAGAADLLIEWIGAYPHLRIVGVARDGLRARELLAAGRIDLVFLDVDLPELSGIDLLRSVRENPEQAGVYAVFTTAYAEYAVAAFDLNAVDFLHKPFGPERFAQAVDRFMLRAAGNAASPESGAAGVPGASGAGLVLSHRSVHHLVRFDDIVYISAHDRQCVVHARDGGITCKVSLTDLERQLPAADFLRIHRQYLVRLDQISRVEGVAGGRALVYLRDEDASNLPVGRSYAAELSRRLGL